MFYISSSLHSHDAAVHINIFEYLSFVLLMHVYIERIFFRRIMYEMYQNHKSMNRFPHISHSLDIWVCERMYVCYIENLINNSSLCVSYQVFHPKFILLPFGFLILLIQHSIAFMMIFKSVFNPLSLLWLPLPACIRIH